MDFPELFQLLLSWRPGSTQLWIAGCLLGWVVLVWLATLLISRPTKRDDCEQAEYFSRPAPLDMGDATRKTVRKIRAGELT